MKFVKALPLTLLYLGTGMLWIYLSDRVVAFFFPSGQLALWYQTAKGFLLVCFTALLLYFIMQRFSKGQLRKYNELRAKDEVLKDIQRRYQLLFRLSPIANLIYETDTGILLDLNQKAVELLCFTKEKIIGKNIFNLLPGLNTFSNKAYPVNSPKPILAYLRPDRAVVRFETSSFLFKSRGINHTLLLCIDVTQREEALDTLTDLQAKLVAAQKIARIGYWQYNFDTGKLFWSDEIYEILGVDKQHLSPQYETFLNSIHPDDRNLFPPPTSPSMRMFPGYDKEHRIVLANGIVKWVHGKGRLKKDPTGQPLCVEGTLQDIDATKKAELAAVEALLEKEMVLERIGDAFFAVDQAWKVTYWNKRAEQILGRKREDIINHNLWEVYTDAVDTPFYYNYHEAMETGQSQYFKAYYEGTCSWFDVGAFPSSTGLSIFFRDITEQVRYINSIEQYNKTLRDIAWSQSHEVRAPLMRLLGLASLIKDMEAGISVELQEILDMMVASVEDLDQVVKKINEKTNIT